MKIKRSIIGFLESQFFRLQRKFKLTKSAALLALCFLFSATAMAAVQNAGPVAGGVTQTSADIFVRTDTAATVRVQFSKTEDFARSKTTAAITTSSAKDYTAQVPLTNLLPGTLHYYRVNVNGRWQQTAAPYPKFTTFPAIDQVDEFRFAVSVDVENAATNPTRPAVIYEKIKNDNPAFLLQLGDLDHRNPTTLAAKRGMHRSLLSSSTQHGIDFIANIGTQMPFYHVWDDHDIGLNDADKNYTGILDSIQAYAEYYSTALLPNKSAGVWHGFRYGPAEIFMLDARSQRDVYTDAESSDKSMLDGNNIANGQKAWLLNGLLNSTARWKFIMSPVPFHPYAKPLDAWAAYTTERNELLTYLTDNGIEGVIVISGDMHAGGIDSGANAGLPSMAVPQSNLTPPEEQFASGPTGTWDIGLVSGSGETGQGYGLVTVNNDQVLLEVKDRDGMTRISYIVE